MTDNAPGPRESLREKSQALLAEKANTTAGMIEKSIIGGLLAIVSDIVTPYLNVVVYLAPILMVATIAFYSSWRKTQTPAAQKLLFGSAAGLIISCAMFVYQQYMPVAKQKGILAANVKGIEELQISVGLIDRRLSKIELGVERIVETSSAIEKNTSATVDELKSLRQSLVMLSSNNGIIPNPKTQVDYYHNARLFAQRGDIDLAIHAYEIVFKFPLKFVDPLEDLIALAIRVYGRIEAQRYIDDKIRPSIPYELYLFGLQKISDNLLPSVYKVVSENRIDFSPLHAQFISKTKSQLGKTTFNVRRSFMTAHEAVKKGYESGNFQSFYLDQLRAERAAREALFPIEDAFKEVPFEQIFKYPIWITYQFQNGIPKRFNLKIFDILSADRILTVCYHNDENQRYCHEEFGQVVRRGEVLDGGMARFGGKDGNAEIVNQFVFPEMRDAKYFCIDKISYKDRDNISMTFGPETFYLVSLSDEHKSLHQSLDRVCMENIDLPIIPRRPNP